METPVVVLDEPTTGQDARGVARIQQVIADLSPTGRTVIAISHDMRFVAESFDAGRRHGRRPGRSSTGTPAEVFAEAAWPTLASTYLEPPLRRARRRAARASARRRPRRRLRRRPQRSRLTQTPPGPV